FEKPLLKAGAFFMSIFSILIKYKLVNIKLEYGSLQQIVLFNESVIVRRKIKRKPSSTYE
ncbi:MAG TPA: hypothetical protein DEF26_18030, partial [Acinetobacter sp.]|nr:hypothetical protein [Acinetobacter sp.]